MAESFPTTPQAPLRIRLGAIAIGLVGLLLATRTTITSSAWVGEVFPGFMLLDNRVIASIGLAHWTGATVPNLYQSEVVAVDRAPVRSAPDVYAKVASLAPGTAVRYTLRKRGASRDVVIATERFTLRDWFLVFGAYLLNSAVFLASGLVVWVLRPYSPLARALLAWGAACAYFLLTAMDLYGPATFFRLHYIGETLLPATALQLVLLFPQPHRYANWRFAGYAVALLILGAYEIFLYRPPIFSTILMLDMLFLGLVGVFFGVRVLSGYWHGRSQLARQRIRVMTIGTLFGFALPGGILLFSSLLGGSSPMNPAAFTLFLLPLSLAYAIVKRDLFEIDAMVKRGAYYLVLTGAVGATYVGAVLVFNLILKAGAVTGSPAFPFLFTLAVLLLFNPVRARLQALVDRVFFRTRYDSARLLAEVGAKLVSTLKRDQIVSLVRGCVDEAIPNACTRLFVGQTGDKELREVGSGLAIPPPLTPLLSEGRIVTLFDPSERYSDPATQEAARAALEKLGAELAVPMLLRGALVGVLTAGAKRSGLFYTAGDSEFLRALAQQAAIALRNADSYEALAELNTRLEEHVRERTAQLEGANRELGAAYTELKNAQTHLIHSEKMASLGRLVAGVAHEINNPVSFISTSIAPLRRRLAQAAAIAPSRVRTALADADEIAGIMARGAERTAAIVKDLRSFSRLGESARKTVDLHDGLEVTLRLLEARWRDRIALHRDYGPLPPVECDPGQMNQVFMNLLANACDAIEGRGNIWITTRTDGDTVTVTIRDDGPGIPAEVMRRLFDPFFTTNDAGGGTGLGLAISHGVVAAHGGRIEVESRAGSGATFRVVLPAGAVHFARASAGA